MHRPNRRPLLRIGRLIGSHKRASLSAGRPECPGPPGSGRATPAIPCRSGRAEELAELTRLQQVQDRLQALGCERFFDDADEAAVQGSDLRRSGAAAGHDFGRRVELEDSRIPSTPPFFPGIDRSREHEVESLPWARGLPHNGPRSLRRRGSPVDPVAVLRKDNLREIRGCSCRRPCAGWKVVSGPRTSSPASSGTLSSHGPGKGTASAPSLRRDAKGFAEIPRCPQNGRLMEQGSAA